LSSYADFFKDEAVSFIDDVDNKDDAKLIVDCEEQGIKKISSFTEVVVGLLRIERGWYANDYVWHIGPAVEKAVWIIDQTNLYRAILMCIYKHISKNKKTVIVPPGDPSLFPIPIVTVKALDIKDCWDVSEQDLEKINSDLELHIVRYIKRGK